MSRYFDIYEYVDHLRSRWKLLGAACLAAAVFSTVVTLLLPKQYRAVARVVIEPPAGSDPRSPLVVSPQYLESLRTYEHFVLSDSLFQKALERFQLRAQAPHRSIEAWKARILKAGLVRSTKVLEIEVTLEDPKAAQGLARFLAEEAIQMSLALKREADQEFARSAQAQLDRARQEYEKSEAAWSKLARGEPAEPLESEVRALESRRLDIDRQLLNAEMWAAEHPASEPEAQEVRGRLELLRRQRTLVAEALQKVNAQLGARTARLEQAEQQRRSAQALLGNVRKQYEDAQAAAGYRGEQLRLIDPGVVPEQPDSPSLPLNLLAAVGLALVAAVLYLSVEFGYTLRRGRLADPIYPPGRAADD